MDVTNYLFSFTGTIMERNIGMINKAFEFNDKDTHNGVQLLAIDIKKDQGVVNFKNNLNHCEEESMGQDKDFNKEDFNKDRIYIKQVVDGEEIYVNLPKDVVKNITNDFSAEFTANGFNYESNLQQSNKMSYDFAFNDIVSVEENLCKDFNYLKMYANTSYGNKEHAIVNIDNELDSLKALFKKTNCLTSYCNTKDPFEKSCKELESVEGLHHYQNILPEHAVIETKQVPGIHNFVANVDSRHNIDANAFDPTNESCFELKLDASDIKVYANIGNTDSAINEIMINKNTNNLPKICNKTTNDKSLISDDNSLNKHSDCNRNCDEIKYRFKGAVFRSFCEKKKKKNWKRRSLGRELKLVLQV